MESSAWALTQLAKLLSLDNESLRQILSYADTLSNSAAAEHLQNLLGDSPQSFEFITSYNNKRMTPPSRSSGQSQQLDHASEDPKSKPRWKKQQGLNRLPPQRQPKNYGDVSGGYMKKAEDEYMAVSSKTKAAHSTLFALSAETSSKVSQATKSFTNTTATRTEPTTPTPPAVKPPPSAAGQLISDLNPSKNSAAKAKAKVSVAGGTPMHGASTALSDLESAIKSLEIQTNPALISHVDSKRKCNCMATRHALLKAAPNCLNCGKIICVKEGIGSCTFCNNPLLNTEEIQSMVRALREERGKEKMAVNNASHKRAKVSLKPRPFSVSTSTTPVSSNPASDVESESEKLAKAKQHRDKLLNFQAQNARRTRVHDEAADFETTTTGLSMWASPQERAVQLKRQQKALREQEWNARPEYEKRRMVTSIDLAGGKIVQRIAAVERPATPESDDHPTELIEPAKYGAISNETGAFSKNPLLGGLIRPSIKVDEKGKGRRSERQQTWRRVQDDNSDNEQWLLDGGINGGRSDDVSAGQEDCG